VHVTEGIWYELTLNINFFLLPFVLFSPFMLALLLCLVEQKRTGNIQQGPSNYVSNFGTRTEACVAVLGVQQHRLL
jgi:hypothetical protein